MAIYDDLANQAKDDLSIASVVLVKSGHTINVGEEFLIKFTVSSKSGHFHWRLVELFLFPNPKIVSFVPNGEGADRHECYFTTPSPCFDSKHVPAIKYKLGEVGGIPHDACSQESGVLTSRIKRECKVRFKALNKALPDPHPIAGPRPYCVAEVRARECELLLFAKTNTPLMQIIYPDMLTCANGHEYDNSTGFVFCPVDGLPLS